MLHAHERAAIDAEFASMASDSNYHALSDRLAAEFAMAGWEAFQAGEAQG